MKKNIILYSHAGSENHGCEALVRSTEKLLHKDNRGGIYLMSADVEADKRYGLDQVVDGLYSIDKYKKTTLEYLKYAIKYRLSKKEPNSYSCCLWQVKPYQKDGIVFSIGGDNYCYILADNMAWLLDEIEAGHQYFYKRGIKSVLWGCSIEEDVLQVERVREDLKKYDLITVRETMTRDNLIKYGIKDNIVMTCDSAFHLDTVKLPLPDNFIEGNTVGINVSPMVIENEKKKGIVFQSYVRLIEYILKETDMNVALIPHVIWEPNDDREVLDVLYKMYQDNPRVLKIEDCNCEELKGYIARCRFFVGARTHASIAAYSSCVPTLVSGYSVKSRGIAKDLFGTYENYVVPVSEMKREEEMVEAFCWIMEHEEQIKETLKKVLPEYKNKIFEAVDAVWKL